MDRPRIALVCPDAPFRLVAARAFDDAPAGWDVSFHDDAPADADVVVTVGTEVAIPGAVRLDPAQPELVVQEVRSLLDTSRCSVVAVVGASGGCGATSIALHLAAATPGVCCIVDLQPHGSSARRLGIDPVEVTGAAAPVPIPGGSQLLCGGTAITSQRIEALRRDFDRIVLDLPRDRVSELWERCDGVVLVMSPTIVAAAQAAELLEGLTEASVALVTNRLGPGGETNRAELQRLVGRRIALELPCSRALRDAEDDCRLLTSPLSPWLYRIRRLSAALPG